MNSTLRSEEIGKAEPNDHVHPTFRKILNGFAPHVPATRKTFAIYYRDFDPLTAMQDECLHLAAFTKDEALADGARTLRCDVSELKAFPVLP